MYFFLFFRDLTNNLITSLNASQLAGLTSLVKLKLNHNPLERLYPNVRDVLRGLRTL